jgi:hypothetical protein
VGKHDPQGMPMPQGHCQCSHQCIYSLICMMLSPWVLDRKIRQIQPKSSPCSSRVHPAQYKIMQRPCNFAAAQHADTDGWNVSVLLHTLNAPALPFWLSLPSPDAHSPSAKALCAAPMSPQKGFVHQVKLTATRCNSIWHAEVVSEVSGLHGSVFRVCTRRQW